MQFFIEKNVETSSYEAVCNTTYRHIATITQSENNHMMEIYTFDGADFQVYISDVRPTINIIKMTQMYDFFGGATVKYNDYKVYVLYFDEGRRIHTTFYKPVYQWVHEVVK